MKIENDKFYSLIMCELRTTFKIVIRVIIYRMFTLDFDDVTEIVTPILISMLGF